MRVIGTIIVLLALILTALLVLFFALPKPAAVLKPAAVESATPKTAASLLPDETAAADSGRPKKEFKFAIAGDAMFDRDIDAAFRYERIFEIIANFDKTVFANNDLSLLNLEGPISPTDIPIDRRPTNLIFNFPPRTVDLLKELNISAVSLANNHSLNNGQKGLDHTKETLFDAGITPIGSQNEFNNDSVKRFKNESFSVSVIAANFVGGSPELTESIKKEKAAGSFVLVFPHFGNEYQTKHSAAQEKLAHAWIDAGADLVIGSHPHVTQDAEIYKGGAVFYSLGNFIFDQYFSKETQRGLIVTGSISETELKLTLLPHKSVNMRPELLSGAERDQVIADFKKLLNTGDWSGPEITLPRK